MIRNLLLLTAIPLLLLVPPGPVRAMGTVIERYENGERKAVYNVDHENRIHGRYRSFYPSGERQVERSYDHGVLDGRVREWDEAGHETRDGKYEGGRFTGLTRSFDGEEIVAESRWLDDLVLEPRTRAALEAGFERIAAHEFPHQDELDPAHVSALRRLAEYRWICGVPWENLELDPDMTKRAQAATDFFQATGQYGHVITNTDWPEDRFELARTGALSSNLNRHSAGPRPLDLHLCIWIMEYNAGAGVVGHRVLCLYPALRRTGFGMTGVYSAMWAKDDSGTVPDGIEYVAFPPPGLTPIRLLPRPFAWSVAPGPGFRTPDPERVAVTVRAVAGNPRSLAQLRGGESLDCEPVVSKSSRHGSSEYLTSVVFSPEGIVAKDGRAYFVTIAGLEDREGKPRTIEYLVRFEDF